MRMHPLRKLGICASLAILTLSQSACIVVSRDTAASKPAPSLPTGKPAATIVQARLYPLNELANKTGVLVATASDSHTGRGVFTLTVQGQNLNGEATAVEPNTPGFGRIYREVLGAGSESKGQGRRGIANAFSANGLGVQCEYYLNEKGIGSGVCLFTTGAKYQMHIGG